MVKKVHIAIASALLTGLLSVNATAATLQEAHAQLDRAPATSTNTQVTAHAVLNNMVEVGVPVDQALEVVRSAVSRNFSARELRQVDAEVRTQVQAGAQAGQVAAVADQSIDAGKSAQDTRNAINTFGQEVSGSKASAQVSGSGTVNAAVDQKSPGTPELNSMSQSTIGDVRTGNLQGPASQMGAGPASQMGAGPTSQMGAGPTSQMGAGAGASAAGIGAGVGANVGTFNR